MVLQDVSNDSQFVWIWCEDKGDTMSDEEYTKIDSLMNTSVRMG